MVLSVTHQYQNHLNSTLISVFISKVQVPEFPVFILIAFSCFILLSFQSYLSFHLILLIKYAVMYPIAMGHFPHALLVSQRLFLVPCVMCCGCYGS
jgi:hypothetical protein